MVNKQHLAKLKEGVEAWNNWRKTNRDIVPDLSLTELQGLNLSFAKLNSCILVEANLTNTNLTNANLFRANLNRANLTNVNLNFANLTSTFLKDATLNKANLTKAKLFGVKLNRANLTRANLTSVFADGANLNGAIFNNANLSGTNLKRVMALATNFEGATLTGACIEDWNINSQTNFKNVKCDDIYLKAIFSKEKDKSIFKDRVPHDPNKIFAPGEFTKRYQKILETVNLYFGEGIDWQVFLDSFQKLQEEEKIKIADGEREIPIVQGIENTGDGSFVIKIGVSPDTDKGEIEKSFWQKYQPMLEAQEEKYQLQLNAKQEQIDIYRQQNTELLEIIKLKASQPINITQQQGDNQVTKNRDIKIEQGNYNEKIQGNYYE